MDDSYFIAAQYDFKGKCVVPWNEFCEPWRKIGLDYAEECAYIAAGLIRPAPRRSNDGGGLQKLRITKGLSQRDLARLLGCSPRTVRRVESGGAISSAIAARLRLVLEA